MNILNNFVHLHLHSEYSLLDGACRIKELVNRVKELGQTAVAVTDHGCMYAAIEFYIEAKAKGIKPIIGCEVYVAPRTRFDKVHGIDNKPYHLVLLCKNNIGYQNLIKLVSSAYLEGFYSKPRIDIDMLKKYSEGLIALSGCLAGEIPRYLINGDYKSAKETAMRYMSIFGEGNYFIEIQNHSIKDELNILPLLYKLSNEAGIPLAATNDSHYIHKEDAKAQKVLIAIQTNSLINEPNSMFFSTDEFYVKSSDEMSELFKNVPSAIENTVLISEKCNVEFEFGKIKLPKFNINNKTYTDNNEYFKKLCYDGMYKKYGYNPSENIISRMKYELDIIISMGYTDYYLIVWDFIKFAENNDIPVGPGRGSGAGSLAAYCIGITGVDPIKHNLLFERFLNPERVSMPDFDIDFCYEGRQKVISYVIEKYGSQRVAQIITFGTMAAKASVRDVARVMNISYQIADKVAKMIPFGVHITLDKALKENEELLKFYNTDSKVHELIDMAKKIEGMPRHASTHAAGVVISDAPVSDYVPLQKNDDAVVTQYPMNVLEGLGLVKMDFLGLRNLTVIHDCVNAVRSEIPDFNIKKIPLDDKAVFDMISLGQTTGVFQFESDGMRQVLTKLKPESIEDLIAVLSLYRPGPMDSIPKYIENRHNPEKITYKHPLLKNILDVTYGCIVYQEQVMEICRKLAGFSYGRADLVRRAMAKKKADVMENERSVFIEGAKKNNINTDTANDIFNEMSGFASYAFNKSHAAAYAYISYQTAYLKCYFYGKYMASLMTSTLDNTNKLMEYISDCERHGVKILRPDINESFSGFTASDNGIRFALLALRNLGRSVINDIIEERLKNGRFTTLQNFCERMDGTGLNRRAAESLIKSGALDCFKLNRRQMIENYDRVFSALQNTARENIDGQLNLFDAVKDNKETEIIVNNTPEFDMNVLLEMEKEASGMYISGHPLKKYDVYILTRRMRFISDIISENTSVNDNDIVSLICIVQGVKLYTTKSGAKMLFTRLEDITGEIEGIVFPEVYLSIGNYFRKGDILFISAKTSFKDEEPKLLIESVLQPSQFVSACENMNIFIKCRSDDTNNIEKILNIINKSERFGKSRLYFYFYDIEKKVHPKNIKDTAVSFELLSSISDVIGIDNIALI